jgi:acetate kinase
MDILELNWMHPKNEIRSKAIREINTDDSKTKILVIPTNVEIEIANQVLNY